LGEFLGIWNVRNCEAVQENRALVKGSRVDLYRIAFNVPQRHGSRDLVWIAEVKSMDITVQRLLYEDLMFIR
jgi:hypothetical protein